MWFQKLVLHVTSPHHDIASLVRRFPARKAGSVRVRLPVDKLARIRRGAPRFRTSDGVPLLRRDFEPFGRSLSPGDELLILCRWNVGRSSVSHEGSRTAW
jgi:hypothetical protein